ncbi:hypothetical protein EC9_41090 [Rosistilla ulvae]|uniref:Uncharacterized protein n=1 Tax=Rosistilla ulvae TaxID=1930277 RepID=A0A517M4W3_9BACT|nr:hypothetical protein [Rosistilla ulvae]QDS89907.1 hypothetical protein EC9_41090 [Rosistilla ulvae]
MIHRVLIGCALALFSTSILSAQGIVPVAEPESRLRVADAKPQVQPLPVVIELRDDVRDFNGSLLDTDDLEVITAFGIAKMPLTEVLGIRMARDESETTTVVLHNGDIITGRVDITNLLVQTSWGKSEVNGDNLASIFFDEGLSWKGLELLAGEKWTLEKAEELAPSPTAQTQAAPAAETGARPNQSVLVSP